MRCPILASPRVMRGTWQPISTPCGKGRFPGNERMQPNRTATRIGFAVLAAATTLGAERPAMQGDLVSLAADDAQWVMPAKNYAGTRYSGLNQINAGNV